MHALRAAVIGAGFGGVGAAIRLRQMGVQVTVLERADSLGGVWRENDYPGAACDVPSYLYSYSFAPKRDWTRKFSHQPEILEYLADVATRFGVLEHVRFGTTVLSATFDEDRAVWTVELAGGESLTVDILVTACGQMSAPAYPPVPGRDDFTGPAFHSARWRHDVELAGKRVAVVGTGASAIQFVPAVAEAPESLTVFQRSPGYVIAKDDAVYDAPLSRLRLRAERYRTFLLKELFSVRFNHYPALFATVERKFRHYLREQLPEDDLRAKVDPVDRFGCKRILISNDWYAALRRPNVRVVDQAVARITADGVVTADGTEHPADVLIYGTGFRATEFLASLRIVGRDGQELSRAWREGAEAYLGITVTGFPNLFLVYGPNTNVGHNSIVFMIEAQLAYITDAVRRLQQQAPAVMDLRPEVHSAFSTTMQKRSKRTVYAEGCTNWFITDNGKHTQNWPGSAIAYWLRTRKVRWADYRLTAAPRERARATSSPTS